MNKIPIAEGKMKGGLKDLEQVYTIKYMPEEEGYCDKVELAIMLSKDNNERYAYRSLRFTQPAQLLGFIMGLIKSYVIFAKYRKIITPKNYAYHIERFLKNTREMLRG